MNRQIVFLTLIIFPLFWQCSGTNKEQKEASKKDTVTNASSDKEASEKPGAKSPVSATDTALSNTAKFSKGSSAFNYTFSRNTIHKYKFTQKTKIQQLVRGKKGFGRNIDGTGELLITPLNPDKNQVKLTNAEGTMIRDHPGRKPTDTVDISMKEMVFGPMNARGVLDSKKGYMALLFKLMAPLPNKDLKPGDSTKITKRIAHQVRMSSNLHAQDFTTTGYKVIKRAPDTTVNGKSCYKFIQRYNFNRPQEAPDQTFRGTINGTGVLYVDKTENLPLKGRMNVNVTLQRDAHHSPGQQKGKKGKVILKTDTYYTLSRF